MSSLSYYLKFFLKSGKFMKPINKAMWFELAGGIFGLIWITASVGAIYFFVQAIFYDGSWVNLVGVLLTGGISKVVLRECEARKNLLMTQESINSHNNKKSEDSSESAWTDEAEKIVQKYGEVLQHASPVAGCVANQDQLPYPKGVIKIALIKALQNTVDNDQKDALQAAYLSLANWQSDVGDSNQGIDLTKVDPMIDPSEFLAMHESSKDWGKIVQKEEIELQAELKELGL